MRVFSSLGLFYWESIVGRGSPLSLVSSGDIRTGIDIQKISPLET